ncbi:MAG: hypothetical protein V4537_14490 [Pseudomonadota bacterium]
MENATATDPMGMSDEDREKLFEEMKGKTPREVRFAEMKEFGEWMIFRVPTRPEWRMYIAKRDGKDGDNDGPDFLLDTCVMYPDKKGLAAQLDRRPGLFQKWTGEIVQSTGIIGEAVQKKL